MSKLRTVLKLPIISFNSYFAANPTFVAALAGGPGSTSVCGSTCRESLNFFQKKMNIYKFNQQGTLTLSEELKPIAITVELVLELVSPVFSFGCSMLTIGSYDRSFVAGFLEQDEQNVPMSMTNKHLQSLRIFFLRTSRRTQVNCYEIE